MKKVRDEDFLIFVHIQKCGGMTIQRMLRRRYGPSLPSRLWKKILGDDGEKSLEDYTHADRWMQGHHCFGVHRVLPKPFAYFTMLREPISRLVSLYNFSKRNPTAYYHGYASSMTVDEFIAECELHELNNGQVRFIAGSDDNRFINRTPFGECGENLLQRAVQNIENHFFHVGVLDRFDKSILTIGKKLNWPNSLYLRRNVGKEKSEKEVPSEKAVDKAKDLNQLDMRLYKNQKERVEKEFSEMFSDEEGTIKKFRTKNKIYNGVFGPVYDVYARAKAVVSGNADRPR